MKPEERTAIAAHQADLLDFLKTNIGLVLMNIEELPEHPRPFLDIDALQTIKGEGTAKTSTAKSIDLLNALKRKDDGFYVLIYVLSVKHGKDELCAKLCESAGIRGKSFEDFVNEWLKKRETSAPACST